MKTATLIALENHIESLHPDDAFGVIDVEHFIEDGEALADLIIADQQEIEWVTEVLEEVQEWSYCKGRGTEEHRLLYAICFVEREGSRCNYVDQLYDIAENH